MMLATPPKTKFSRALAISVARVMCDILKPVTTRLVVAGSLRRMKDQVGDVEILYVPKCSYDLLGAPDTNLADVALQKWLNQGTIAKRRNALGSETWGKDNKLAVHVRSGIPVDLFTATEANWWNYLVCRTGGAEHNVRIASAAQTKGWTWQPYSAGFLDEHSNRVKVESEQDVFRLVGIPYLEPRARSGSGPW